MKNSEIPRNIAARVPLFKEEWLPLYTKMGEHPHAPKWNTQCGDRLFREDLGFVMRFDQNLRGERFSFTNQPPASIIEWCVSMKGRSEWFASSLSGLDIERDWSRIPVMTRGDMQSKLELIIPGDADLSRLVVNPTSGTTGHPIPAPNHPASVGCYDPLIQYALSMNGLKSSCRGDRVAAIQVCSQKKTITYHTVHSYLDGAGFAKINLEDENWRTPESAAIYIDDMKPVFLSGDPYSFLDYIRCGMGYRPDAILSTAIFMEQTVRNKLETYFRCPVVDMYSLNETGPVAYSCPHNASKFHILPHDIFVEIVSDNGEPLPEGESGEVAVTGGRNPYLPLLRYLTGDRASMSYGKCSCGEATPAITKLDGRRLVLFRNINGKIINSIDIAGIIRSFPVYSFSFRQRADYSCTLKVSAGGELTRSAAVLMKERVEDLFRREIKVDVEKMEHSSDSKHLPFICELEQHIL